MVRADIKLTAVVIFWTKYQSLQVDRTRCQTGNSKFTISDGRSMWFKAGSQSHDRRAGNGVQSLEQ